MNRTVLTSAGVPFKEFVVTCRYTTIGVVSGGVGLGGLAPQS